MPSNTPNINLNKGAHGDWPDFWDQPVNQNWDIIDALFGGSGHAHTGVAGDGPQLDHNDLLNIGTLTHAQLEAIAEKLKVTVADTTADYLQNKLAAGANITLSLLNPGANEQLQIDAAGGGSPWVADDEYGAKHTTPTSAPVVYTDNFNWPLGFYLHNADYLVSVNGSTTPPFVAPQFLSTGYSANAFVDTMAGDSPTGTWTGAVRCQIPHSPAQRCTLSLTDTIFEHWDNVGYAFVPDLQPGDYICFTLAVYSTHQQAAFIQGNMPQQFGVFLAVEIACTAPATYTVSHHAVLVTSVKRIDFPICTHTNVDDFKGCWELSLDHNGHLYTYWRRQLVWTSQTIPPTTSGPIKAEFAQLTTDLVGVGEQSYGAIGFGMRHALLLGSRFKVEVRWFSLGATDDIYDEEAECAAVPFNTFETPEFPKEILSMPPGDGDIGILGAACCPGISVGKVLDETAEEVPLDWVTACGQEAWEGGTLDGYYTHLYSDMLTPCAPMTAFDLKVYDLEGSRTEGEEGVLLITGIGPVPASLLAASSNPDVTIENVVPLEHSKVMVEYSAADGTAGPWSITFSDKYNPGNSLLVSVGPINEAALEILGATYERDYNDEVLLGMEEGDGTRCTFTGKGINPTINATTAVPNITLVTTYVGPDTVRVLATPAFDPLVAHPPIVPVIFKNDPADPGVTYSVPLIYAPIRIYEVDVAPDCNPATPGVTVTITGNNFKSSGGGMAIVCLTLATFAPTGFAVISRTQCTVNGANGAPGAVTFSLTNPDGTNLTQDVFTVGAGVALLGGVLPVNIYEGVKNQQIIVSCAGTLQTTAVAAQAGPPNAGPYASPGNFHTVSRILGTSITSSVDIPMGFLGPLMLWLYNPGQLPWPAPFAGPIVVPSVAPSALVCAPPSSLPNTSLVGVVISGTDVYPHTEVTTSSPFLTITNVVGGMGSVTFDLAIGDAPEGSVQSIELSNPGGMTTSLGFNIEFYPPAITTVECLRNEFDRNNATVKIVGDHFYTGGIELSVTNATLNSYTHVSDQVILVDVTFGAATPVNFKWTNPDGSLDDADLALVAERDPVIFSASIIEPVEGATAQHCYIHGAYLDAGGTGGYSIAFVNANFVSVVTWTASFIHCIIDITGLATNQITASITGSVVHPSFDVAEIVAPGVGPVTVTSTTWSVTPPMENSVCTVTFQGSNMMQVASIEGWYGVGNQPKSSLLYVPWGVLQPITFAITAQNDHTIQATATFGPMIAPDLLDIKFLDSGFVTLLTLADVVAPTPYVGLPAPAPVFQNVAEFNAIVEVGMIGIPQAIVVTMASPLNPLDTWVNDNIVLVGPGAVPNFPIPGQWTINFAFVAPGPYCFNLYAAGFAPPTPPNNWVAHGRSQVGTGVAV